MTSKSELKARLRDAERRLSITQAELYHAKLARDEDHIRQGLIPIEYLVHPQFIETGYSKKAQVTITNQKVIAALREASRPATFEKLLHASTSGSAQSTEVRFNWGTLS